MAFILKRQAKTLGMAWAATLFTTLSFIFWITSGGPPPIPEAATAPPAAEAAFDPNIIDISGDMTSPPLPKEEEIAAETPTEPQNLSLLEDSPHGPLPRIADDGNQPWQAYAQPIASQINQPIISIVITGMGLRQSSTRTSIEDLPAAFTLAFSPYGRDLENWAESARQFGHETLLMLPMEPIRYPANNPGPDTFLRDASTSENIEKMQRVMGRMQGYVGLINDMGSAFTASEDAMKPILVEAKNRGLMFVDARSTHFSVASALASDLDLPNAHNNRFLDHSPSEDSIRSMLSALEQTALSRGAAVGVARPLPVTLRLLQEWATKLQQEGRILLVPVSTIANRQPIR